MSTEPARAERYQKDPEAERILAEANRRLAGLEAELVSGFTLPQFPTVFIVGAPRSGTTLLLQLLLARFELGYVSNAIARFWMAPFIGTVLARELARESDAGAAMPASRFGATSGAEGPHEFGYFWRRWFRYGETHDAADTEVVTADAAMLGRELAAVESAFGHPLVLKNLVCSFHIGFLADTLPRAVFIHCRRVPVFAAQSILKARIEFHGDRGAWFSVKPAEYKRLRRLSWEDQIAGQIHYTRQAIERQFRTLAPGRRLELDYESICRSPEAELDRIAARLAENDYVLRRRSTRLPEIATTNRRRLDADDFEALRRACDAPLSAGEARGDVG